jgi:ring-1,2-phenylacetyl-CoA epoxidase subunit PaaD
MANQTDKLAIVKQLIRGIPDPEIPVINIEELGLLRDVKLDAEGNLEIIITPTYTGCPAMQAIETDIARLLNENNITGYKITTVLSPAWTTDWITQEAKEKLRDYGIAPPEKTTASKKALLGEAPDVKCPRCKSINTIMVSQFGSTACKALYKCNDCLEPFDYFKCL